MTKKSVYISQTNCITPLGFDVASNFEAVLAGKSAIKLSENYPMFDAVPLGEISNDEINHRFTEISPSQDYSRLEKLLILALYPIIKERKITEIGRASCRERV